VERLPPVNVGLAWVVGLAGLHLLGIDERRCPVASGLLGTPIATSAAGGLVSTVAAASLLRQSSPRPRPLPHIGGRLFAGGLRFGSALRRES